MADTTLIIQSTPMRVIDNGDETFSFATSATALDPSQNKTQSYGRTSSGILVPLLTDSAGRMKVSHGQPDATIATLDAVNTQIAVPSDGFSDAIFYFDPSGSHVITFENSPDSTNGLDGIWFPTLATNQGSAATSAVNTGTITTADSSWRVSAPAGTWIRARVTTMTTSGNINAWATTTSAAAQPQVTTVPTGTQAVSTTVTSAAPTLYTDSSTNLAAAATFTGTSRDSGSTATTRVFSANAFSDKAGTLRIQKSTDATTWRDAAVVSHAAGVPASASIDVTTRYNRVTYTNTDATITTALLITSAYHRV